MHSAHFFVLIVVVGSLGPLAAHAQEEAPEPVAVADEGTTADEPAESSPEDVALEVDEPAEIEEMDGAEEEDSPAEDLVDSTADAPPVARRRLIFVDSGREALHETLTLQLPDWHVRHLRREPTFLNVDGAQSQLMPTDAVVWIERSGDVDRVALLGGDGDTPITSTLPAEGVDGSARAFALVVEGLIREQAWARREDAPAPVEICESNAPPAEFDWGSRTYYEVQAQPRRRSRWPSPIARDGWLFRVGWVQSGVPRRETFFGGVGVYQYLAIAGGVRLAVGHWIQRVLRLTLVGEFAWAEGEPEGSLGIQAMLLSKTRLRMGAGIDFSGLVVSEYDWQTRNRFGWVGYRIGLPMEIGVEVNRRGGFTIQVGPTFTKAPYASMSVGYSVSVAWEFN